MTGKMNKRPAGVSRRTQLEDDLTGQIAEKKQEVETGRYQKSDTAQYKQQQAENRVFQIKQGKRRRHPDTVLAQFATIKKETTNANSVWEQALLHEQARIEVPAEYKASADGMVANQMGLATTALENYTKSKGKLERIVGVGY